MNHFEEQLAALCKKLKRSKACQPSSAWTKSSKKNMKQFMKKNPIERPSHNHFRLLAYRPVSAVAGFLMVVILLSGSTSLVAQGADPGDTLYPVKIATEKITVIVAASPESKAELHMKYADRRIGELEKLYTKEPYATEWHEQVAENIDAQMNEVTVSMETMDLSPEYAAIALKFEELARRHRERMELLEQELNTSTIVIINDQQALNQFHHERALKALIHAQEMMDTMYEQQERIQERIDKRFELLEERQKLIQERIKKAQEEATFSDSPYLFYATSTPTSTGDSIINIEVNGDPIIVSTSTDDITVITDTEHGSGVINIETDGGNSNIDITIDSDTNSQTSNTTITTSGSSLQINGARTFNTHHTQTIRVNGRAIGLETEPEETRKAEDEE